MLGACTGHEPPGEHVVPPVPVPVAQHSNPDAEESTARHYYRAYLEDVVAGDIEAAEQQYQKVVSSGAGDRELVARAALRLASWAIFNILFNFVSNFSS